jgi:phosphate starvation-inducible membrane PsiE
MYTYERENNNKKNKEINNHFNSFFYFDLNALVCQKVKNSLFFGVVLFFYLSGGVRIVGYARTYTSYL